MFLEKVSYALIQGSGLQLFKYSKQQEEVFSILKYFYINYFMSKGLLYQKNST